MKKIVQPEPEFLNLELASKKSTKLLKTNRNWRTESGRLFCIVNLSVVGLSLRGWRGTVVQDKLIMLPCKWPNVHEGILNRDIQLKSNLQSKTAGQGQPADFTSKILSETTVVVIVTKAMRSDPDVHLLVKTEPKGSDWEATDLTGPVCVSIYSGRKCFQSQV